MGYDKPLCAKSLYHILLHHVAVIVATLAKRITPSLSGAGIRELKIIGARYDVDLGGLSDITA